MSCYWRASVWLLFFLLCAIGCSSDPPNIENPPNMKEAVLGEWRGDGASVSFNKNFFKLKQGRSDQFAGYEWIDDDTVKIHGFGEVDVTISGEDMTLTFSDGRTLRVTRVDQ